jgi:serine/threonine protein kinase
VAHRRGASELAWPCRARASSPRARRPTRTSARASRSRSRRCPTRDPFHAWALVDLLDPSSGRLLELDLLILGYACLYLVELKAWPGRIEGDAIDWQWVTPDNRRVWRDNPRPLAHRKAQILKSRLERVLPAGIRAPWIEPLVFLTDANVKLGLTREGLIGVVRRDNFADAITHHEFPGADPRHRGHPINAPTQRAVLQGLRAIGFRERRGKLHAGSYVLGELLAETDGYQDRDATHRDIPAQKRRARTYLVPEQTSVELRQQLRRAAGREAQLLYEVREHPNVLTYTDYVADAEVGPTVLFDAFTDGIPLDAFLRREPDLAFTHRVAIIEGVSRALAHCHRRRVAHGGVSPSAILVRRGPEGKPETRLFNFQLGGADGVDPTSHRSNLGDEQVPLYQAPELRKGLAPPDPCTDLFSLGAIAYLVFTGQPPGTTLADVDARLAADHHLDPRAVSDALPREVIDLIAGATQTSVAARFDDATAWIELLLDAAAQAAAAPASPEPSPLDARKGDVVAGFLVHGVLGHGASSRVLEVERDDGRRFALKVSLGPDHDDRLRAEARALARLRHPRIVELEGPPDRQPLQLGGRPCLLMSLAGETLQRELAAHGAVSLDYAARYGTDLLGALEHLEEREVLHRDIKPANVGVGAVNKKAASLTLFDFSLAAADPTDVRVGTAAYRDPEVGARGRWDAAADRYSAAMTLYELLTGQRPASPDDATAASTVRISAERIDAGVRAPLAAFFATAFARAVTDRHPDAKAMRRAWERAFEAQPAPAVDAVDVATPAPEPAPLADEAIAAIAADTPVHALPLSARAKNALDRAGVLRAVELLDLPENRISAIRGVGKQVALEILDFRRRWTALAKVTIATREPAFFPGYRGDDLMIHLAGLASATAERLADAGLRSLALVAAAPRTQLANLARTAGLDDAAIRATLSTEHAKAAVRSQPTTLGAWCDALLPAKKRYQHARELFGLDGPRVGVVGTSPRELADLLQLTPAAIYLALGKARDEWAKHPAIATLAATVHAVVERAGGAVPLARAGIELLSELPHAGEPDAEVRAAALVRLVADLEKDDPAGLRFVRLDGDAPWIVLRDDLEDVVRRLGTTADELAGRDVLAGPAEVARALTEIVDATPLAGLSADRLVRLAAAASRRAAASTRLELYPRDLTPARTLELSAAVLTSPLVRGRAAPSGRRPLPGRAALAAAPRARRPGGQLRAALPAGRRRLRPARRRRALVDPHQRPLAAHHVHAGAPGRRDLGARGGDRRVRRPGAPVPGAPRAAGARRHR